MIIIYSFLEIIAHEQNHASGTTGSPSWVLTVWLFISLSGTIFHFYVLHSPVKQTEWAGMTSWNMHSFFPKVEWSGKWEERSPSSVIDAGSKTFPNLQRCLAIDVSHQRQLQSKCRNASQHPLLYTLIASEEIKCRLDEGLINEGTSGRSAMTK